LNLQESTVKLNNLVGGFNSDKINMRYVSNVESIEDTFNIILRIASINSGNVDVGEVVVVVVVVVVGRVHFS
jgi:hypothetical protein